MEKYDDYLICNPEKMENIAREYQRLFSEKNKLKKEQSKIVCIDDDANYEKLKSKIGGVYFILNNMHNFCGTRFYASKKNAIKEIICKLEMLPMSNPKNNIKIENFCGAVGHCVCELSGAIDDGIQALKELNNKEEVNGIINSLSNIANLIPLINNLYGVCKFRM